MLAAATALHPESSRFFVALLVQRRSHAFCDHGRLLVGGESDRTLKSLRASEQHPHVTTARIGGDPSFVRCGDVPAASFHGSLDPFTAVAGIPLVSKTVSGIACDVFEDILSLRGPR